MSRALILSAIATMSDFEDFQEDFDWVSLGPSPSEDMDVYSSRGTWQKDLVNVGSQRMPPPLQSRPHIDFSGQHFSTSTDVGHGFTLPSVTHRPPSHLLGSTLHTSLNHPMASFYPQKQYSPYNLPPDLPPEVLESLTVAQLYQNSKYRQLQHKYKDLCEVLTSYAKRDLVEPHIMQTHPAVLDIRQEPHHMDSRASSLAPSDSASQQQKVVIPEEYVESLLQRVELPVMCPHLLPVEVLWDLRDCSHDLDGVITESNKHRPRMSLAIHEANGRKISLEEYKKIRKATEIVVKKLNRTVNSDPRAALYVSTPWTKTFFVKWFLDEFNQAVLDLEAQKTILRLCLAHWKAKAMITLVLQNQNEGSRRASTSTTSLDPSNVNGFQFQEPWQATPIPPASGVAPSSAAKRALEFSPSPKSPSASHTQKRSKDDAMLPGQKTASSQRPSGDVHQRPTARRVTPSFLSRTDVVNWETTPTRMRPVYIDPSADNLISIFTSEFPSMTSTPNLLRSFDTRRSFQQGETSKKVTTLLERVQSADPGSPDYDEDDMGQGWGHYQFMAGGLSPATVLTSWQEVGNVDTAFKLVAAAIKTCQEARLMCKNAGAPKTTGFLSNDYLKLMLEHLEKCWVDTGGVLVPHLYPVLPTTPPSYSDIVMSSISPKPASVSPPKVVPMSPPKAAPMSPSRPVIKFRLKPLADIATTSDVPAGTNSIHQQSAGSTEPSATLDQVHQCLTKGVPLIHSPQSTSEGAALLKSLLTLELQAWIIGHGLVVPKWKHKDDLIAAIVKSPEFAQVTKSSIEAIIEKRKQKKAAAVIVA